MDHTADSGTKGFAERTLPPFLAKFQQLNEAYNVRRMRQQVRDWEEKRDGRDDHRRVWCDAGVECMYEAKDWADRQRLRPATGQRESHDG